MSAESYTLLDNQFLFCLRFPEFNRNHGGIVEGSQQRCPGVIRAPLRMRSSHYVQRQAMSARSAPALSQLPGLRLCVLWKWPSQSGLIVLLQQCLASNHSSSWRFTCWLSSFKLTDYIIWKCELGVIHGAAQSNFFCVYLYLSPSFPFWKLRPIAEAAWAAAATDWATYQHLSIVRWWPLRNRYWNATFWGTRALPSYVSWKKSCRPCPNFPTISTPWLNRPD